MSLAQRDPIERKRPHECVLGERQLILSAIKAADAGERGRELILWRIGTLLDQAHRAPEKWFCTRNLARFEPHRGQSASGDCLRHCILLFACDFKDLIPLL